MEKSGQLVFSDPLSYIQFSKDGKHLFVLTSAQRTYLFDAGWLNEGRAKRCREPAGRRTKIDTA